MRGKKLRELPFVVHENNTYKPGDCVLINPDAEAPAYIARIRKITTDSNDRQQLEVTWFYRPEEVYGGRKAYHGERELFDSDHTDKSPVAAIIGRCNIHSVAQYERLGKLTESDFYVRFKYRPRAKQFEPDRVPVYCRCSLPYNPDRPMVLCSACEEWFHPQCINVSQDVLNLAVFTCPCCEGMQSARREFEGGQG